MEKQFARKFIWMNPTSIKIIAMILFGIQAMREPWFKNQPEKGKGSLS
jgi:hypothetical protein